MRPWLAEALAVAERAEEAGYFERERAAYLAAPPRTTIPPFDVGKRREWAKKRHEERLTAREVFHAAIEARLAELLDLDAKRARRVREAFASRKARPLGLPQPWEGT